MGDLMAIVPVAVRLARGSECIEARAHGIVADGMDMHRKAGRVELLDQPREALRIEIKLAFPVRRLAVDVEIGR